MGNNIAPAHYQPVNYQPVQQWGGNLPVGNHHPSIGNQGSNGHAYGHYQRPEMNHSMMNYGNFLSGSIGVGHSGNVGNTVPYDYQSSNTMPYDYQSSNTMPYNYQSGNTMPYNYQSSNTMPYDYQVPNHYGHKGEKYPVQMLPWKGGEYVSNNNNNSTYQNTHVQNTTNTSQNLYNTGYIGGDVIFSNNTDNNTNVWNQANNWQNASYVDQSPWNSTPQWGPVNPGPINPGPINPGPINPGPINPGPINPGPYNPKYI